MHVKLCFYVHMFWSVSSPPPPLSLSPSLHPFIKTKEEKVQWPGGEGVVRCRFMFSYFSFAICSFCFVFLRFVLRSHPSSFLGFPWFGFGLFGLLCSLSLFRLCPMGILMSLPFLLASFVADELT